MPKRERADQARGIQQLRSEDEMPTLEALIRRIVKEGKRSAGEREVSKEDTDAQSRHHSKPHG